MVCQCPKGGRLVLIVLFGFGSTSPALSLSVRGERCVKACALTNTGTKGGWERCKINI